MPRQTETRRRDAKIHHMTEVEGLSAVSIAEILDVSVRTVEKARQRLREKPQGRYVFIPKAGDLSNLSAEGQSLLEWTPEAFIAFFNKFSPYTIYGHHRAIVEELFTSRRVLVNVPPRHGKSRLISIWFVIWLICRNRNASILVLCNVKDLALEFIREIAENLTDNMDLIAMFGQFAPERPNEPGSLWRPNSGELVVLGRTNRSGGLSIQGRGANQRIIGRGFDYIVGDDVADLENSATPDMRDKLQKWWDMQVMSRLTPAGRSIVIGTRVNPDDLYGRLKKKVMARGRDRKIWRHVNFPAVRVLPDYRAAGVPDFVNGFALWPEVWALNQAQAEKMPGAGDDEYTSLEDIYAGVGADIFNATYLQNPQNEDELIVTDLWISQARQDDWLWGHGVRKREGTARVIAFDPPQENYGAILTADIACGLDPANPGRKRPFEAQLIELVRARMEVPRMRQELQRIAIAYDPDYLIMEINQAQRWFLQDPWAKEWAKQFRIRVIKHTTTARKDDKTRGFGMLSGEFEFNTIHIPDGDVASRQMFAPLVEELSALPYARTDDCAAALWFMKIRQPDLLPTNKIAEERDERRVSDLPVRLLAGHHRMSESRGTAALGLSPTEILLKQQLTAAGVPDGS